MIVLRAINSTVSETMTTSFTPALAILCITLGTYSARNLNAQSRQAPRVPIVKPNVTLSTEGYGAIAQNESRFAEWDGDRTITIQEFPAFRRINQLYLRTSVISSMSEIQKMTLSPNGKVLAVLVLPRQRDPEIVLWQVDAWSKPTVISVPTSFANEIVFSPDSVVLAVGGDKSVFIYDFERKHLSEFATGLPGYAWALAFSDDGASLAIAVNRPGDSLQLWDVRLRKRGVLLEGIGAEKRSPETGPDKPAIEYDSRSFLDVAFSHSGSVIAAIAQIDGRTEIDIFNTKSGRLDRVSKSPIIDETACNYLSIRYSQSDKSLLAIATFNRTKRQESHSEIHLLDASGSNVKAKCDTGGQRINSLSVSTNGKWIFASASKASLWWKWEQVNPFEEVSP